MVLQPAIEGMLGLDVRAQENKVILAPHLPADWDSITVTNIKIGEQSFDFTYHRTGNKCAYRFVPNQVYNLELEFLPTFPAGTIFTKVSLNGQAAQIASLKTPQYTTLVSKFNIKNPVIFEIEFDKGISVLPVTAEPKPGEPASGLRLISSELTANQYIVELEAKSGSTENIKVYINDQEIEKTENAKIVGKKGKILELEVNFDTAVSPYNNKSVLIFLK
jgi:hypothetical protein